MTGIASIPDAPSLYPECGTYAGRQQHARANTPTCEPCRLAAAEYTRSWRARSPKSDGGRVRFPIETPAADLPGLGAAIARGFRESA